MKSPEIFPLKTECKQTTVLISSIWRQKPWSSIKVLSTVSTMASMHTIKMVLTKLTGWPNSITRPQTKQRSHSERFQWTVQNRIRKMLCGLFSWGISTQQDHWLKKGEVYGSQSFYRDYRHWGWTALESDTCVLLHWALLNRWQTFKTIN